MHTTTRPDDRSVPIGHLTNHAAPALTGRMATPLHAPSLDSAPAVDPSAAVQPDADDATATLERLLGLAPLVDAGGVASIAEQITWVVGAGWIAGATPVVLDALADPALADALRERAFAKVISAVRVSATSGSDVRR